MPDNSNRPAMAQNRVRLVKRENSRQLYQLGEFSQSEMRRLDAVECIDPAGKLDQFRVIEVARGLS